MFSCCKFFIMMISRSTLFASIRSSTWLSFLIAIYSPDSLFLAEMTLPYVPLPISLIVSYLIGSSNMIPLKSVQAKPGMFEGTVMPLVYSVAAADVFELSSELAAGSTYCVASTIILLCSLLY